MLSRSRRILLVAHTFGPDSWTGVELYTARLGRELQRRGHQMAVFTARQRPGEPQNRLLREEVGGLSVFGVVQNWPYRDLPEAAVDPAVERVFSSVLREFDPDLVAVQTLAHLSMGLPACARERGVPVVMHLHDAWWSCASGGQRQHPDGDLCLPVDFGRCGACFDRYRHREGPLERAGRRLAARLPGSIPPDALHRAFGRLPPTARDAIRRVNERAARRAAPAAAPPRTAVDPRVEARRAEVTSCLGVVSAALSPSRFLAESLRADGVPLPEVHVVPTGVEPPVGPPAPRAEGRLRVLFCGTWVPHKGPHVLAAALARMQDPPDARGVGPDPFPQYRADVEAASGGRLLGEGASPPERVGELLSWADVVVVPSTWAENAPLIALEARAHGRPVLASRLGGLPELVEHGVDGLLFTAGRDDELAALLSDPARLLELGGTVRPPRTVSAWVDDVERRYEEVLA